MNFVGPFAEAQTRAALFLTSLLHTTACTKTIEALGDMAAENTKLAASGQIDALTLNKLDQEMLVELMFSSPVEKDV